MPKTPTLPPPGQTLNPDEVGAALGLSRTWVYAHLRAGTIRSTRLGRLYRVSPAEVQRIRKEGLPPITGSATGKRKGGKEGGKRGRPPKPRVVPVFDPLT